MRKGIFLGIFALRFAIARFGGERFHNFAVRLYVDFPAGEFSGETSVLSLFSYCERKFFVGDDNFCFLFFLVYLNHLNGSGTQSARYEFKRVGAIRNNIDFFTAELGNDCIDAAALRSDARAYSVDGRVVGRYR